MYYIYAIDASPYLSHHGIKGQKWGVRRYQNPDGSLTDEGRRRYGYGSERGRLITQNTKDRSKQGAKIGAKIGAAIGVGGTAAGLGMMAVSGFPLSAPFALGYGATYLASATANGALYGLGIGAIVGASETHKGRQYLERYDEGLKDFEMKDLTKR